MPESEVTLLTQNAWGGAPGWAPRRERLARAIADLSPDVVGLQEIHAEASVASGEGESQEHELARLAGDYAASFLPGRVTADGHSEGVALLIKRSVPVLETVACKLSRDEHDLLDGPHQRVALRAAVRVGDSVLDAVVTHLSLSKRARARTLVELGAFASNERERGAVLMGDFNATPDEAGFQTLAEDGWVDAWAHTSSDRGGTWPSPAPFRRIDYVWVRRGGRDGGGWDIRECTRTAVSGSDHVGVLVRLRRSS